MLAEGAWADLLLIDLDSPTFAPLHDFNRQLVYGGSETDIKTVMIGGRVVFENRRVTTIDEEAIRRRAHELTPRMDASDPSAGQLREEVARLWHETEARPLQIRSYLGPLP